MKEFLYLLGIVVAGALGYKFEPQLRAQLTGAPPTTEVIDETVIIEGRAATGPTIDPATLAASQLPEKVLLKTDAKVADSSSGIVMTIDAGNQVRLVRIEGQNVIISPGQGPFVGKVAISDTDLLARLAAKPPSPVAPVVETPPMVPPAAPVAPEPAAPVVGDSQEPPAEPAPAPEPAPMPEPTPAPTPEAPSVAGSTDVVKAMQDSIKAAQIKEFTFEQVLNWEAAADETVDGESYQTGLASYKAETIFGVKTIQAKALLKGGKVQRWIWPKSGMEIK